MSGALPGSANPNWKGGRTTDPRGYVLIKMPEHPAADVRGYVYEHRLVMERELSRLLACGERIRHDDNDPGNNDPLNLRLVSPLDYGAMTVCVCGCGTAMTVLDNAGRIRRFVSGHNSIRGVRAGARPKSETGAGLDPEWREETLAEFAGLCAYGCGRAATQWDHLIPWSQGGSFRMPGNAVPACRTCNQRKSADPDPWKWIDRALAAGQAEALLRIVDLAISWGMLDVPYDDEFPRTAETAAA
ncbi:MAG TPA: HNH endonuclease [Streptosporangiaceae bacterium]|nr:HNH endonuclease [Streptosporangiaceae bacterium]